MNNSLNKKILYENEFEIYKFIKSNENLIFKLITNIFILLKDNNCIFHIDNYENFNFMTDNNISTIKNKLPLMVLLGGSSYSIYSKLFNNHYKKDIIDVKEYLIDSIDYDFSIVVTKEFNKNIAINIVENFILKNTEILFQLNMLDKLNIINKNDIKNDDFLCKKHIINKNYNKYLITCSHSNQYTGIQFTLKYNNTLFQIVEILFWYDNTISENIHTDEFIKNKCIFYQTNEFKILLPNLVTLIKSNVISIQSRIMTYQFNKCAKDYYRIKYIKLIYDIKNSDILTNNAILNDNDIIMNNIIINTKKIYSKNPNIFKLPYSICSLENTDKYKKDIFNLYNDFLNLNLDEQINIFMSSNLLNNGLNNI
jgi:hypothetical protein